MNASHLNIGIIHSLIGKNDGVSIVIDQTVKAMVKDLGVSLGNIHFLAAHSSPRFNAETNEVFWHKSETHKRIITQFSVDDTEELDQEIHEKATYAQEIIKSWVDRNNIDLIIAHNTSHTYNFITAVGLGYYFEELKAKGTIWPKIMVWWHDSWFEREEFSHPSTTIQKYLKYVPGTYLDSIVFINNSQIELAKRLFKKYNKEKTQNFFQNRIAVIPNTSDINWNWQKGSWDSATLVHPEKDNYNESFFDDVGLTSAIESDGFKLDETVILLQHTRVVPRKKIEVALDFTFELSKYYKKEKIKKCFVLLISGHSGDEQTNYKNFLIQYYQEKIDQDPEAHVYLIFGESIILSHRDIIVDKKYYKFAEIPAIVAAQGGIGTYFSSIEGFGNNLLEMIAEGLPVAINKYQVYKEEIEPLGFILAYTEDCYISETLIKTSFDMLENLFLRNRMVYHNLAVIEKKLDHKIISTKLLPIIKNIFTQTI